MIAAKLLWLNLVICAVCTAAWVLHRYFKLNRERNELHERADQLEFLLSWRRLTDAEQTEYRTILKRLEELE